MLSIQEQKEIIFRVLNGIVWTASNELDGYGVGFDEKMIPDKTNTYIEKVKLVIFDRSIKDIKNAKVVFEDEWELEEKDIPKVFQTNGLVIADKVAKYFQNKVFCN